MKGFGRIAGLLLCGLLLMGCSGRQEEGQLPEKGSQSTAPELSEPGKAGTEGKEGQGGKPGSPNGANEENGANGENGAKEENGADRENSGREENEYSSRLPVIYLNTKQQIGEEYVPASMWIDGNGLYADELLYEGNLEIKLRGNSTKYRPKRPYKIKLEDKADLFGMGANKHWVLLANDIDHTLIRNKVVYDFAAAIGMDYAPESVLAAVVLDGSYQGVYQLCEHVRVGKERVNIFDWEDLAENIAKAAAAQEVEEGRLSEKRQKGWQKEFEEALTEDFSWLREPYVLYYQGKNWRLADFCEIPEVTGGFLLEMDFYAFWDASRSTLITNFQQPVYFNTPESVAVGSELYQYARDYVQAFEYALHSEDFVYESRDTHYAGEGIYYDWGKGKWLSELRECDYADAAYDGCHYSELFDLDSLVQNFLVCEFTMNWDSMKNSVFVYKDLEGPARIGPVWDFDWAFGNVNMYAIDTWYPTGWQTTNDYFTNEQYYQSVQWNRYLIRDPYFVMKVFEKYHEIREGALAEAIASISYYENWLAEDGKKNDAAWDWTYRNGAYYAGSNGESFEQSFSSLREFISIRMDWLEKQFADLDTLLASLGRYEKSDLLQVMARKQEDGSYAVTVRSRLDGCAAVELQVNGTYRQVAALSAGEATVLVPASCFSGGGDMITAYALDSNGEFLRNSTELEANAVSNYCYLP